MSSNSQESLLGQLRREIRSKIYSVSSDIRPVSGGRLGFIRVTSIPYVFVTSIPYVFVLSIKNFKILKILM